MSRESLNHIPFGNDGKTLFVHIAGIHAKTYTTRSLVFLHLYVGGRRTKRLPFGMRARFWFVGRKMYSRVQSAIHKDPGEVRCTLSLERIPIRLVLVFHYKYIAIQTNREICLSFQRKFCSRNYTKSKRKTLQGKRKHHLHPYPFLVCKNAPKRIVLVERREKTKHRTIFPNLQALEWKIVCVFGKNILHVSDRFVLLLLLLLLSWLLLWLLWLLWL